MKQQFTITIGILLSLATTVYAQKNIKSLNDGWSFRYPDSGAEWVLVSLPHTYNLDAYSTRDYYKGEGEYRRNLKIDEKNPVRRYFIKFDAANKAAALKVNGSDVKVHLGGYSAFCCDVTPYIVPGDNEISVMVDNSRLDIPPLSADFTFWGGIYRDAWLISTPLQHFDICDYASSGVYATPMDVSDESATLKVKSHCVNESDTDVKVDIVMTLDNRAGEKVASVSKAIDLAPLAKEIVELNMPEIRNPKLWSPETPYLYSLKARIVNHESGEIIDETIVPVGFRWFSFEGQGGFKLNGKHYKLRGINRHQDQEPMGVALDDEAHRRDIRLLKDLGCNFIRLAHYQQDDAVLDECDRLGLIVWEEIPVVNMVPDEPGFDDNCEKSLVEMIRQHYNHPSVMMWGYMNEILLRAPSENSLEWNEAKERIISLANRLENKLKDVDSTRASVMAFHGSDRYNKIGLGITDVQGWNLYQGWYGGDLSGFEKYLENQRSLYPERSLIVSEWGAGSDKRLHSSSPVPFDFSIEYQQKYIEHYLPYMEKNDYISGGAYWNFIDFNVAERQESMPRVNNKGIFYNNRQPKDVAYYFKSMWRNDIPVVHIAVRDRDAFIVADSSFINVKVYSNCPEVELFINGVFLERKVTDNCFALFKVPISKSQVSLTAKGQLDGMEGIDVATVASHGLPDIASGETLSINVGSNCDFTSAVNGQIWLYDRMYQPGKWGYLNGERRATISEIFNTHDTPIYQSMLEGVTDYCIDAPKVLYEIDLLFADINKSGNNSPYLLGRDSDKFVDDNSIKMSVNICGQLVESSFSPSEASGFQHAVRKKYIIDNVDGHIRINLTPISGKTNLCGISVRKVSL